jgi:S-(hydroxymethyl)glutathione dehydrogenase / alcohol dehydrogenase
MKAVVFHSPKNMKVDDVEDPRIVEPRDAIVRVTSTAICGSDLHIYNGFFPQLSNFVMGHEFMGVVEETGSAVTNLRRGDRVVVPFPIACGACFFCQSASPVNCEHSNPEKYGPEGGLLDQKGGGLFGYTKYYGGWNGGQAEFVRVPFADYGPRRVPEGLSDEKVLFLTDIFPTGWTAVSWAKLKGGETVAVFGAGPVGIMAAKSAWLQGAGRVVIVDIQPYRLAIAARAAKAETIDASDVDPVEAIRSMTDGRGADVCIDAVGMEADRSFLDKAKAIVHGERGTIDVLRTCFSAVRRAGVVSVVGVYGTNYDNFPLAQMFDKGIRLQGGQAPVHNYIDELIPLVATGKVVLDDIITHTLPLSEAPRAYEIFNKKQDDCLKVVLKPGSN